jgi:hypothetical protein
MILEKIISGGQTGADLAALDVALEYGIPHGGWVSRGRRNESGTLPDRYRMKELSSINYPKRTELNIVDSDGTLILSHGKLSGEPALASRLIMKHRRPSLHVDLQDLSEYKAAAIIKSWIETRAIKVLNVTGPKASEDPRIYGATERILKSVLYPPPERIMPPYPKTVDEAVQSLLPELSAKERIKMAGMKESDLASLQKSLGKHIMEKFGLSSGNASLLQSCDETSGKNDMKKLTASEIIIRELWKRLKETHSLRIVK